MASFPALIKKETLHIVRDTRTMMIVIFIPIILMLLFGFAISTEVNNINVAAVVPANDDITRNTLSRLDANPYITFKGCIPHGEIDNSLRSGCIDAVVVFGNDPTTRQHIITDASNTNIAQAASTYLRSILSASDDPTTAATQGFIIHTLYNPQLKSAYNFVPGIMGMLFILICAMMTSVSIVREKETGTMEVLLVSPVNALKTVVAKIVPYFALSCIVLTVILVMAYTLLGLPLSASAVNVAWVSLLYITLSLALGLLISAITSKQIVALIVSAMLLMLPVIMLSGMIFPIENMPEALQYLSAIVPARWYISAMRKFMIEQLPLTAAIREISIMLSMAAVIIGIAVGKFNDKLE